MRLLFLAAFLLPLSLGAQVIVHPDRPTGPVKPMNGVNNGPGRAQKTQVRSNFDTYSAAGFAFARTHDSAFSEAYGSEHTVDITAIFPDFSRDPADPAAYDFAITDWYLGNIRDSGTEIFFRLGQKIQHHVRKYGVDAPADNQKWASIAEHIIRHYNEGWADGFHWNIRWWEIWNEPDLGPETWNGTAEQFHAFYQVVAKQLKGCFPHLMIGGPAVAGNAAWTEQFLRKMAAEGVPLDFFSWHIYRSRVEPFVERAAQMRLLLDRYGYGSALSILDEWNYIRNWTSEFPYSIDVLRGMKGAAFNAAVMCRCQTAPVDILMYYDARPETIFNGLFDFYTYAPLKGYYAFYAWSRLRAAGTAVQVDVGGKDLLCAAAVDGSGHHGAALVVRYTDDDNVHADQTVTVSLPGVTAVRVHLTDRDRTYTEIPAAVTNGTVTLRLAPSAFAVLEW